MDIINSLCIGDDTSFLKKNCIFAPFLYFFSVPSKFSGLRTFVFQLFCVFLYLDLNNLWYE